MRALFLSLIALGACAPAMASERITQSSAEIYETSAGGGCEDGSCGQGAGHFYYKKQHLGGWFGHMPQTCYSPRYGCYYGNNRHMHRYPAFHGTYYRRPYNYRNLFDYPWHAEMHEPTSMFSYNVAAEEMGPSNIPTPTPSISGEFEAAQKSRSAAAMTARHYRMDTTHPSARPASTLRR